MLLFVSKVGCIERRYDACWDVFRIRLILDSLDGIDALLENQQAG